MKRIMDILSVDNITKNYGPVRALQGVSFGVPQGSVYGILGPNGSGKTTLLGVVTDVLKADAGSYTLFGDTATPPAELRKRIGALLETPNFYHYLSAYDNLAIAAGIKGVQTADIERVLRKVGLYERRLSCFSTFSLGMKQRLGIASALLGDPQALILDEPTNGLDPEGIAEIRTLLKDLGAAGHTIIMASHLLDEVEKVCTHVAILKAGRLLAAGRTDEILADEDTLEVWCADPDALCAVLRDAYPGATVTREPNAVLLGLPSGTVDAGAVNGLCFSRGIVLDRLALRKRKVEDIFLELVNNSPKPTAL